ncbi:MAG TPA: phosphate ABC transporter substrate-binding protein [Spirochaetota bacterium]|nr:phosphate ABC transporter substrate-binding protein [Spirochaetota bacterium]HPI88199.1 phosphate ABC transporter substrate-binding protein [Spirochaetota bacterium]HPR47256.1 phosphate ABC transporter substrate-binding protein [Spirochaetota bacterium]
MKRIFLICALMVLFSFNGCKCIKETRTLVIAGSTTIEPIVMQAAKNFEAMQGIEIVLNANGSHSGIDSLLDGHCDIAESSSPLSDEERAKAAQKGLMLQEYAIARDFIVPVVNKKNPLKGLSISQLNRIFSGRDSQWATFGWDAGEIVVVVRDANSGTRTVWNRKVLGKDTVSASVERKPSSSSVLGFVSENQRSIGYVSRSFINSEVKTLAVDGKLADIEHPDETYPLQRELYLYTRNGSVKKEVKSFIIFLLSRQGQDIIRKAGFIPLPSRTD